MSSYASSPPSRHNTTYGGIDSLVNRNHNGARYNTLLLGVARQLADLKKAVKGLVVVTPELEEISQTLLQGKVRYTRRYDPVSNADTVRHRGVK